ncbi:unnamed protein product [Owenia fusiformis]|uniref:Importin subunit alpha n=1 Tax=Owenia fusiformis TaxID=6347 RepID=A0A8S4Q2Y6_OWEFU|nr:unnamed protein product [Owenia fusiformis]
MEEVTKATSLFHKSSKTQHEKLTILKRAFAQGTVYIDHFMQTENAVDQLIGLLSGNDADVQLDAAWCVTNIATGTDDHAYAMAKVAGPYLVTFLSGSNHMLQDQCAWALGNIAGDGPKCRDLVIQQGALPPLVQLLQAPQPSLVQSAAFALSNMIRGDGANTKALVDLGAVPLLLKHITLQEDNQALVSEVCWVLTYLAVSGDHEKELVDGGFLETLATLLVAVSNTQEHNIQILTPALRCLGNVCSGPNEITQRICQNKELVPALGRFLHSDHYHVRKECLWALSNMTGDTSVCQSVLDHGLLAPIIALLGTSFDIKREAVYCLCNLAYQGPNFCQEMLKAGVVQGVVPLLKSTDIDVTHVSLSFVEMMLRLTDNAKKIFEEAGGMGALELLEYHSNEQLRAQTNDLLEKYFYTQPVDMHDNQ